MRLLLLTVQAIFAFTVVDASAESTNQQALPTEKSPMQVMGERYLEQWFGVDPSHEINLEFKRRKQDQTKESIDFVFTGDDGFKSCGTMLIPNANDANKTRLALLAHPMGSNKEFWLDPKHKLKAADISASLVTQGHIVIVLDARKHGCNAEAGFGPRRLIEVARSEYSRQYLDTIIGSVRDYRQVLNWAVKRYKPTSILVSGYSMGAQMSLLLAAYEMRVNNLVVMVPPFVDNNESPVAPRMHTPNIQTANVLWLAAERDQFSDIDQTQLTFELLATDAKRIRWFDSAHVLPATYVASVIEFIEHDGAIVEVGGE